MQGFPAAAYSAKPYPQPLAHARFSQEVDYTRLAYRLGPHSVHATLVSPCLRRKRLHQGAPSPTHVARAVNSMGRPQACKASAKAERESLQQNAWAFLDCLSGRICPSPHHCRIRTHPEMIRVGHSNPLPSEPMLYRKCPSDTS